VVRLMIPGMLKGFLLSIWHRILAAEARKPSWVLANYTAGRLAKHNSSTNNWVVSLMNVQPEDSVLEVAYGPGCALEKVSAQASRGFVAGVDVSPSMYKAAYKRNKASIESGRVRLHCCDALSIPYPHSHFDKLYAINVAYFWYDTSAYLRELFRVLRPGGRAFVSITDKDSLEKIPVSSSNVFKKFSEPQFASLLREAGFGNITIHSLPRNVRNLVSVSVCFVAQKEEGGAGQVETATPVAR
jgi:ubiquinone/menaquinone biosynthesis C-methylase UbiE